MASDTPMHEAQQGSGVGSLADEYRRAATDASVRWDTPEGTVIWIPNEQCKTGDVATLCEQVCGVIRAGGSVAVAARAQIDTSKVVNHKQAAMKTFTFAEQAMFKDWENGLPMGEWDFAANASGDPINPAKLKRFTGFAAALCVLYKTQGNTPEQAKGWTIGNQALMPICWAQCKIMKAQRDAAGGQDGVDPKELLEKRVLNRIQGLIGRRRNAWGSAWRALNSKMSEAERCIQLRLRQLEHAGKRKRR